MWYFWLQYRDKHTDERLLFYWSKMNSTNLENRQQDQDDCHAGGKPLKCWPSCVTFTRIGQLKKHQKHTVEKRFACMYCSLRFTKSCYLKRHSQKHIGEKPFACTHCSMKCAQLSNLKSHIARVHSVETDQDNNTGSSRLDSVDENSIQNEKQESLIPELNNGSSPLDCEVNVTLMDDCKEDDSDYKQTFQNDETLPSVHSGEKCQLCFI